MDIGIKRKRDENAVITKLRQELERKDKTIEVLRRKQNESNQAIVRLFVKHQFLPEINEHDESPGRHDEQEAVAFVSSLVEARLISIESLENPDRMRWSGPGGGIKVGWSEPKVDEKMHHDATNHMNTDSITDFTREKNDARDLGVRHINKVSIECNWSGTSRKCSTARIIEGLSTLNHLETLELINWKPFSLTEALSHLPNLRHLTCHYANFPTIHFEPPKTTSGKKAKLESLYLPYGLMNESVLSTFLLNFLPCFPNLRKFELGTNQFLNIHSFQSIAQTIRRDLQRTSPSRLRCLKMGYSDTSTEGIPNHWVPTLSEILEIPAEIEALKTILLAFPHLHQFGRGTDDAELFRRKSPELAYLMDINDAGRVLVEGTAEVSSSIALSVWPTVLARAGRNRNDRSRSINTDGVYYLVRNTPALLERRKQSS